VIQNEMAKNPFVMDQLTAPITDAIAKSIAAWTPSASTTAIARSTIGNLRALSRLFLHSAVAADTPPATGGVPQLLTIQGASELSGFTLNLGDDNASVYLQNSKRRPGTARVFLTGYTDQNGVHTDLDNVEERGDQIPVPATQRLTTGSAISSIGSLFASIFTGKDPKTGTLPWSPINSANIPLSAQDGAVETDLDVVVLVGVWNGAQPDTSGIYAAKSNELRHDVLLLRAKEVFDATILAILENLGIGGFAIPDISIDNVEKLLNSLSSVPELPAILKYVDDGVDFIQCTAYALGSEGLVDTAHVARYSLYREALLEYVQASAGAQAEYIDSMQARVEAAATDARGKFLNASKRVLAAVSVVLLGVDTIVLFFVIS
jgi:hypothetical protein